MFFIAYASVYSLSLKGVIGKILDFCRAHILISSEMYPEVKILCKITLIFKACIWYPLWVVATLKFERIVFSPGRN